MANTERFLISRDSLAKFLPDNDTIRRFEKLFQAVAATDPANFDIIFRLIEELSIAVGSADARSVLALNSVADILKDLNDVIHAPLPNTLAADAALGLAQDLEKQLGTIDAKANQVADLLASLIHSIEADPDSLRAAINAVSSSLTYLGRELESEPGSIRAALNSLTDVVAGLSKNNEAESESIRAAVNRVADSQVYLGRSLETDASRPPFIFPRTFSIDYIDWDQNPAYFAQTARMAWNNSDDTLNLHHSDGVTQQMGQELYGRILNNTGVTIPNGTCLGINPATNSYVQFIANGTLSPITIVGVTTQDIPDATQGRITVWGRVRDIDTTGTPYGEVWTAGEILYVSTTIAGGFTRVKPTAPNLSLPIAQVITVNATTGQIAVRPTVEQQLFYGQFAKTTDQVPSAANTAQALTWDSSLTANGVTIGAPTSRIVCANAGLYKFSVSLQLTSSSASVKNVWVWFRKNGVDVANSSLITSLDSGTAIRTPSRSLFFSLAAGDYVEVYFASDSTNMTVDNVAATAFAPAAPAALLSVNQEQQ